MTFDELAAKRGDGDIAPTDGNALRSMRPEATPSAWSDSIATPPAETGERSGRLYSTEEIGVILALAQNGGSTSEQKDGLTEEALLRRAEELGSDRESVRKAIALYRERQERTAAVTGELEREREILGLPASASVETVLLEREIRDQVGTIMREMTDSISEALKQEEGENCGKSSWSLALPKDVVSFSGFGPIDRQVLRRTMWDVLKVAGSGLALAFGSGPVFAVGAVYAFGVVSEILFGSTKTWGIPTLFGPDLHEKTSSPALNELLAFCKENGITARYHRGQVGLFAKTKMSFENTVLYFEINRKKAVFKSK